MGCLIVLHVRVHFPDIQLFQDDLLRRNPSRLLNTVGIPFARYGPKRAWCERS